MANSDEVVKKYRPTFDYSRKCNALPITCKPEIILPQISEPSQNEKLSKNEHQFLEQEHKIFCQLMGFLPVIGPGRKVLEGMFVPKQERMRQIEKASEKKKELLRERYGINRDIKVKEDLDRSKYEKMLLRHGERIFEFKKMKRKDNARSIKLSIDVSLGRFDIDDHDEYESQEREKKKLKFRLEMKQKQEDKLARQQMKKIEKRKKVFEDMVSLKKERTAAIMKAALEAASSKIERKKQFTLQKTEEIKKDLAAPVAKSINEISGLYMNVNTGEEGVKRRKSKSVAELKEELKAKLEKKRIVSKLHETGEDDLANDVKMKLGWEEASAKLQGQKVHTVSHLSKNVKRLQMKGENRYKKLNEVLQRQKQGRHTKLVRKQKNIRSRRIDKVASKMVKLEKRGHIVPAFMM